MDKYTEPIPLKVKAVVEVDKSSTEKAEKDIKKKLTFKDFAKDFGSGVKDKFSKNIDGKEFGKSVSTAIINAGDKFVQGLKNAFSDAWEELSNMLSFSKLSSSKTREYAFNYGFSGSQAYGFDKAMNIMGYQSEEDLMYMNSQEQRQFQEAFKKYSEKYSQLYDSGFFTTMQDYEYEMNNFKEEMKMQVVEFFMDNKETIKTVLKASMSFFEFVIKSLGFIVQGISGDYSRSESGRLAATNEIIKNSSTSTNSYINVRQDNTYNNVDTQSKEWLTGVSNSTYEQIVTALGG